MEIGREFFDYFLRIYRRNWKRLSWQRSQEINGTEEWSVRPVKQALDQSFFRKCLYLRLENPIIVSLPLTVTVQQY
jgi:hypothetical protein